MQSAKSGNLVIDKDTFDIWLVIEIHTDMKNNKVSYIGLDWETQSKTEFIEHQDVLEVIELPKNVTNIFFQKAKKVVENYYKKEYSDND